MSLLTTAFQEYQAASGRILRREDDYRRAESEEKSCVRELDATLTPAQASVLLKLQDALYLKKEIEVETAYSHGFGKGSALARELDGVRWKLANEDE